MLNKVQFTEQILIQLVDKDQISVEQAMKSWWQDIRSDSGFRLSSTGFEILTSLDIECHRFEVNNNTLLFPRQLLVLNKKLDCPYYIQYGKHPQLVLFGSQQAVLYAIYGDLEKFLVYLQRT